MASLRSSYLSVTAVMAALYLLFLMIGTSKAQLSSLFYKSSCPNLLPVVKSTVEKVVLKEQRMGASLLRLFFHDCFVNGCDGSILLDDTGSFKGEKTAPPNNKSVRGYDVVDNIKNALESVCPSVVSCADILAIAARDSVVQLGGPDWEVKLGRRDAKTATFSATTSIPAPFFNVDRLISSFASLGFTTRDMVALSGAHTIGSARCVTFRQRLYNEANIDPLFARELRGPCPSTPGRGDDNLAFLDGSKQRFDNSYFQSLMVERGLLHSDQQLFVSVGEIESIVDAYVTNQTAFFTDFAAAMVKMGDLHPLTGTSGEIRKKCRFVN